MKQSSTRWQSAPDMGIFLIGVTVIAIAAIIALIIWEMFNLLIGPEQAKRFSDFVDTLIDHLPAPFRPA